MSIQATDGSVFHTGKVVAFITKHNVQIMSDVWANQTFAVVFCPSGEEDINDSITFHRTGDVLRSYYKPQRGYFQLVFHSCSEFGLAIGIAKAEVDAPQDVMDIYAAHLRGKSFAHKEAVYDREEHLLQESKRRVSVGREVRVVRGRKVKPGTEGKVFFYGDKGYGRVVGIALPDENGVYRKTSHRSSRGKLYESYDRVAWVSPDYVKVIDRLGGREL